METPPTCTICLEHITENNHVLDCGHNFHTTCIIKWFRSDHNQCPNCRKPPEDHLSWPDSMERYTMLRSRSRSRTAPKRLKRAVALIKKNEKELKEAKKKAKEYQNDPVVKACLKRNRELNSKRWRLEDRLNKKKRRLGVTDFNKEGFQLPNVISTMYYY